MSRWMLRLLSALFLAAAVVPEASGHDPITPPLDKSAVRREIHLSIRDFSLVDQDGKAFQFRSLRGKVVLVSFIYTTCPDICPLITTSMRLVQENLRAGDRPSVYFLSITTDPEVDTPEVLRAYAARYKIDSTNWSFLTGGPESLGSVWKGFGVRVERKARGLVNHTPLTALIDKKGVMRFAYYGSSPDHNRVLQDLHRLIGLR